MPTTITGVTTKRQRRSTVRATWFQLSFSYKEGQDTVGVREVLRLQNHAHMLVPQKWRHIDLASVCLWGPLELASDRVGRDSLSHSGMLPAMCEQEYLTENC